MLLQTASRGWELGLLVLVLAGVGLVSYWVYRDAAARGMDDAPYWGAAVGVAFVVGMIVGGIVAVGVYLSARPDEYVGAERPFAALHDDTGPAEDPAHADLPPAPELTAERVEAAGETTLRGYARRYDRLDATGDPEQLRGALRDLVDAGETDRLGETVAEAESDRRRGGSDSPGPAETDHRRHAGRPLLRDERAGADEPADSDAGAVGSESNGGEGETENRDFDWVEER